MGEIYRPDDLASKRRVLHPDLPDIPVPTPSRLTLEAILEEIRALREDVEKIKRALRAHGIRVD